MRLKPVPEPPTALADLREYQRAVPLVPERTDDCCARLRDRRDLPNRQVANDWLAFLRALGLVRETSRGFVRTDAEPTPDLVRTGLRGRVLLVPEALDALRAATPADPVTPDGLFERTRESVPRHDRARDPDWEESWRERANRLLRWLALVDLAEPVGSEADGYVAGDALAADPESLARAYYDALDAGEYDRLADLLDPAFVQHRPDRTFEGRDRFVTFMRDERPLTDTTHAVDAVFPEGPGVAVCGRLLDAAGDELFAFVDVFTVADGRVTGLETYAQSG
ncbi:hypothetical protein C461_08829 [Halorubrum aidingense JCM 13560]|uniref:SnoaL-like domain-containing protein n=1 Tax=Halorubrum aidingense JCM 13560 TaxID=1230454 RepID=M0PE44_9EURY|nr:hypothetical protein C461_08829 [Halorubrum aidingense JCM 13560]